MDFQNTFNQQIDILTEDNNKKNVFKKLSFKKSWSFFKVKNKKAYFIDQIGLGFDEKSNDVFVNKIKLFLKKKPWVFSMIYNILVPSFAKHNAKKIINSLPKGSVVLNLGSGVTNLHPDIINVDFYPFENVDFVADISDLPFLDNSVDGVISECVLEHTPNPSIVVSEMHRVLKLGGVVYVIVPFVFSFHSSPHDFYRWSNMGLRTLFKDFKEVECGIHFGAGNAVNWVLAEYFGTLFSFGFKKLHQVFFMIFLVVLTPFSYLDYFLNKFKTSENIASHIYYVGKKYE